MSIPEFRSSVEGAVRGRPDIFSKAGTVQAEQLIVEPFVGALTNSAQPESRFLVIVDSLEECKRGEQDVVLDTIATIICTHNLPFLFLITSHPELESPIRNSFSECSVKHLNLSDPRSISTDLSSESATSASGDEEASYIRSLVFGNNNPVPPGGPIFDESGVFLTDALDLSHLNELGLWDMDIKTHTAMQEAVKMVSNTIETFIWRFNLDAPPSMFRLSLSLWPGAPLLTLAHRVLYSRSSCSRRDDKSTSHHHRNTRGRDTSGGSSSLAGQYID
jgi:hypothetical protein